MPRITWIGTRPANADALEKAIEPVFGPVGAGTVEIFNQGDCLDVRLATSPAGKAYRKGDSFDPLSNDHKDDVREALRKAGAKTCGD